MGATIVVVELFGWRRRRREAKSAQELHVAEQRQEAERSKQEMQARIEAAQADRLRRQIGAIDDEDSAAAQGYLLRLPGRGASLDTQIDVVCSLCVPGDQFIVREKARALLKGRVAAGDRVLALAYVPRLTKATYGHSAPEQLLVVTEQLIVFKSGGERGHATWAEAAGRLTRATSVVAGAPLRMWHCTLTTPMLTHQSVELWTTGSSMPMYLILLARDRGML